jgi:hypothetical protein
MAGGHGFERPKKVPVDPKQKVPTKKK